MKAFIAIALAVLSSAASALEMPEFSQFDHRIRSVVYNREDVVQLDTVIGVQTHIQVEDGEKYVTHAFGDSAAYAFATVENHFFIKPKADDANTNLTIVTNRRVYNFRLSFHAKRTDAKAMYSLSYEYPDTQRKLAEEARRVASIDHAFNYQRGLENTDYDMWGDLDIAPINTWDDQEFTYFKFSQNTDMPGVYMVDADGNESLVNRSAVGLANTIYAVQKVSKKWMLRLGERALAVENNSFDPLGVENITGTKSPAVQRVIKGN